MLIAAVEGEVAYDHRPGLVVGARAAAARDWALCGLAMGASPAPAACAVTAPAADLKQLQPERIELIDNAVQRGSVG